MNLPNNTTVMAALPQDAEALLQRAQVELAAGADEAAAALFLRALDIDPSHATANHQLGILELRLGRPGALVRLASALKKAPQEEQYWLSYIGALSASGDDAAARQVLAMGRQHGLQGEAVDRLEASMTVTQEKVPAADIEQVMGLLAKNQLDQAMRAAHGLIARFPTDPFGWKIQAGVHRLRFQINAAVQAMEQAVLLAPDDAEVFGNLGNLLIELDRPMQAQGHLRRALALGETATYWNSLGVTLEDNLPQAEAAFRRGLELAPERADITNNLARCLHAQSRTAEAAALYRHALVLQPDYEQGRSNMLFCLSQVEDLPSAALLKDHLEYGAMVKASVRRLIGNRPPAHMNGRDPHRQLRIGLVSGDLRTHAMVSFLEPVMATLATRPQLKLFAYYNYPHHDSVSAHLRSYVSEWRDIYREKDEAAAAIIRADEIDILIDLSGHTGYNRLPLFAHKPAPVQVTWMGYPGTTGLKSMDYCMVDRMLLPPGQFDHLYVEKLVYLATGSAFQREPSAPDVGPLPALARGTVTFGSFNRISKMSRPVIALWARLMHQVPGSRLLIGAMPFNDSGDAVAGWLAEEGIGSDRLTFHCRSDIQTYLALHQQIDICLDTFPYTGGTTTMHAMTMGVPTLTIAGQSAAGRQSACILEHAGLQDFIASDADTFVQKGVAACARLEYLASVRVRLRARFLESPSEHDIAVVDCVEAALRVMWQRWCKGQKPAAFEVGPTPR